jgi:hypothetical protein
MYYANPYHNPRPEQVYYAGGSYPGGPCCMPVGDVRLQERKHRSYRYNPPKPMTSNLRRDYAGAVHIPCSYATSSLLKATGICL